MIKIYNKTSKEFFEVIHTILSGMELYRKAEKTETMCVTMLKISFSVGNVCA